MEINITALDYFRELELMEKQYGQEEDLYPWIYMLLQMTKKSNKISIRDVHKHGYYTSFDSFIKPVNLSSDEWKNIKEIKWKIRWLLSRGVGHPEFAIIDLHNSIIGAVEIKILDTNKRLINEKEIEEIKNENHIIKGTKRNEEKCVLRFSGLYDDYIKFAKEHNDTFEMYTEDKNCPKGFVKKSSSKEDDLLKENQKLRPYPNWKYKRRIPTKEYNQLMGHIDKFGKVLYTNGLEFYLFTKLNDNEIKFEVLSDFTDDFKNYNGEVTKETEEKWKTFTKKLSRIPWTKEPNEVSK